MIYSRLLLVAFLLFVGPSSAFGQSKVKRKHLRKIARDSDVKVDQIKFVKWKRYDTTRDKTGKDYYNDYRFRSNTARGTGIVLPVSGSHTVTKRLMTIYWQDKSNKINYYSVFSDESLIYTRRIW